MEEFFALLAAQLLVILAETVVRHVVQRVISPNAA